MTTQSRSWCFTLNNPTLHAEDLMVVLESHATLRYAIFQLESGEGGTEHYQGYIELKKPTRMRVLQALIPRAHFEPRRGTRDQARDYCKKEDTRIAGPFEIGTWESGTLVGCRLYTWSREVEEGGESKCMIVHERVETYEDGSVVKFRDVVVETWLM